MFWTDPVQQALFQWQKDIPVSVENIVNNAIDTESLPNPNFVWNILLVYSFD